MAERNTGDGRVTLAVLKRDVEHLTRTVENLRTDVAGLRRDVSGRLNSVENSTVRTEQWRVQHGDEHDDLKAKSRLGDMVNGVGVLLAGLIGVLVDRS